MPPASLLNVLLLVHVCTVQSAQEEEARCHFPDFLQTPDTKSWMLNHTEALRTHYINGGLITVFDCRKDNRECSEYKRLCWKEYSNNKFLVKHLESDFHNRFLCIQFIKRSASVVQIKLSHPGRGHIDKFLCRSEMLDLDPWPWISEQHFASSTSYCPFSGGYNFDLFKFSDHTAYKIQRKCTNAMPPVRIESDCEKGEGMTFLFRSPQCLHKEGNLDVLQNAKCIASWRERDEAYGVLRKDSDRYFWCIRVKFGRENEVTRLILFLDLICDHTMNFTLTKRYIELEILEKRRVTHMCTDVYYGCEVMNELCTVLSDLCAKTCGGCNASHKANTCDFPQRINGNWLRSGYHEQTQIKIVDNTISLPESGEYECVTFQDEVRPLRRVILRRFNNGCYPRFMCMHFDLPAPSIMRMRLGNLNTWPTNLSDDSICDVENFMTYPDVRGDVREPYYRPFQSMVRMTSPLHQVTCNLPGSMPKALMVYDDFGVTSCLFHGTYARPREMFLSRIRDDNIMSPKRYTCIGSLTFIGTFKSILTVTNDNHNEYLCWIIVSHNFILIVKPPACNTLTANYIMARHKEFEKKLVQSFYVTYTNSSSICDDYFDEHYAYKPAWEAVLLAENLASISVMSNFYSISCTCCLLLIWYREQCFKSFF